ncbi:ribonuclease H-like domain-containing protein [Tanacetum coccineum]|uniref:Ribonuclease H-like domain-containing protein n=1 Tax=Tanacetum coccineum TaxID=301880 RepID=A0ABQ5H1R3_9ASTR
MPRVTDAVSLNKARLVANSSTQLKGVDVDETFSSIVKPGTIQTVLSLATSRHWLVYQLDVKNAFLHDVSLWAQEGPSSLVSKIITSLHHEFSMTDVGSLNYFLGIYVTRDSLRMFLSQRKYAAEILEWAHMVNCNPSRTPVDTESKLGDDDLRLQLFSSSTTSLVAYSNADWAGCPTTRRTTLGYYVFLGNNLLSWSSKRQPTLSRFSADAKVSWLLANVVLLETFIIEQLAKDGEENVFWSVNDEIQRMFPEVVILIDDRLVKLIDITLEQWLDLKFGDHKKVDKEIMEGVVGTWLIQSYRKQFEEYMEIKKAIGASKFNNHMIIDWYIKSALWLYWKSGDDEDVLTYDELSDLKEENLREVPWVEEKPWLDDGTWKEPNDDICHECKPYSFKSGHVEWPTCNWKEDRYCNGGNLPEMIQVGNMVYFQNYEWYEGLEDGDLKEEASKEKAILEGSWGQGKKEEEESREDAWSNYFLNDDNDAIQANQERFDDHEPMKDDDNDIGDLDDYLI